MDFGLTFYGLAYIVAIVIPGLIFKRFYFQGKFSKQFFDGLFVDRLLTNIFWGILIQIVTIFLYCWFYDISYEALHKKLNAVYVDLSTQKIPSLNYYYIKHGLRYLGATILTAIAMGWGLHLLIRFLKLDIFFTIFRFSNHWHYYFSGEALRFREFKQNRDKVLTKVMSTEVDVVVKDSDGNTNMFTGFLTQYTLCRTGELDTIYLTDAKRFVKQEEERKPKVIPGNCFVIPYSNILNLNVRYNLVLKKDLTKGLIKSIVGLIVISATILSVFFVILYPWFVAPGFWRKLSSSLILLVSWTQMMTVVVSMFPDREKKNQLTSVPAKIILLTLSVFLGLWGLVIAQKLEWSDIPEGIKMLLNLS